jgi:hypothetical protein
MTDELLLPDLETMSFGAAKRAVQDLPADSDFGSLKARELAREKGPRPAVIAAIDARLGIGAEGATVGPAAGTADSPPPSARLALPELPIREYLWRGHLLYICTAPGCRHQTFYQSVAYAHALTHPQKKE